MSEIKSREKTAIIESLKVGIVPKIGLRHIQVGRKKEISEIIKDLEIVSDSSAKIRFIIGDYGSGKTFFLTLSKLIAHEKNFVVASADISEDKILSSSDGRAKNLFSELINNMSIKSKSDGGALRTIIEKWLSNILTGKELVGFGEIKKMLEPLENYVSCYDFSDVLKQYLQAYLDLDEVKMSFCLRWLKAEYQTKLEAKRDLGVRTIIDDNNFYDYIRLFATFVKMAGYDGLIVSIDELAVVSRLKKNLRDKNFERLLMIINDCLQGNVENLEFIFGGTIEFLEDEYKGMYSYGALKSRLADNQFSTDECRDYSGIVIRLGNLTPEELFVLLQNIRNVFAEYKPESYLINDKGIEEYMKYIFNKLGAQSFLSQRETVKNFVGLLLQLQNNPDKNLDYFLNRQTIKTKKGDGDDFDGFDLDNI
jgi:hypothetical protein